MLNSGKDTPLRGAVERSGTIVTTQFCPAYIKYAGYDFREGKGALGVKRAAKRSGERRESGSCTMCVRPISITNQIHRRRAVSARLYPIIHARLVRQWVLRSARRHLHVGPKVPHGDALPRQLPVCRQQAIHAYNRQESIGKSSFKRFRRIAFMYPQTEPTPRRRLSTESTV
jgi:hypothetical protein